jgi:hypothetical protein
LRSVERRVVVVDSRVEPRLPMERSWGLTEMRSVERRVVVESRGNEVDGYLSKSEGI